MAVTRSCLLFPDLNSPAAGKMLPLPEVRSRRFKCPSALEAGVHEKNPHSNTSFKSFTNVIEEIMASLQVLQYILYMEPVYPVQVCPGCGLLYLHSVPTTYLPSVSYIVSTVCICPLLPLKLVADFISCQRGGIGTLGGVFWLRSGVRQSLRQAAPSCGHSAPGGWQRAAAAVQQPLWTALANSLLISTSPP